MFADRRLRRLRHGLPFVAIALTAAVLVQAASGGSRPGPNGTFLVDGAPVFPIVLSKGPPRGGTTPSGGDALDEVVGAGVDFLKVGPATTVWTDLDLQDAVQWDRAAAARGVYTWVNLSTLSQAQPGSNKDTILQKVVTTLKGDAAGASGLGMWKGADEPWWNGFSVSSLQFAYCLGTSRGDPGWCSGETPVDADHAWVTIEAPRGTAADLAPYTAVTDTHGVDEYPIGIGVSDPDLHQVGRWTSTIASITPNGSVWTTLQVCSSASYSGGEFVLPTTKQERYMVYDAIINGARSVGFYGGNNPSCWSAADRALGWNWTFWNATLKGLVGEIRASSPLGPALVNPGSTEVLAPNDPTTQAISRRGVTANDLWILAARSGGGTADVTIGGLPAGVTSGSVYTEGRSVSVSDGAFTDTFGRWDVHVYHFTVPSFPTAAAVVGLAAQRASADAAVVRWRAGGDARALGFNVYAEFASRRARLNLRLIPVRPMPIAAYVFRTRVACRYWVEEVRVDGSRSLYGPVRVASGASACTCGRAGRACSGS